jgi:maltose O-acetyltransferase
MRTEKDKMLSGELYNPFDPQLSAERRHARLLVKKLNDTRDDDDVWIGGGVIICPGVRIGARSAVGAGSVVTKDIPEAVVAAATRAAFYGRWKNE